MNTALDPFQRDLRSLPPIEQLAVLCLRGLGRREADLHARLSASIGPEATASVIARCDDLLSFLIRHAPLPLHRNPPDAGTLTQDELHFARLISLAERDAQDELFVMAMALTGANMAPCLPPLATAFALTLTRARAIISRPRGCPVHHSPAIN